MQLNLGFYSSRCFLTDNGESAMSKDVKKGFIITFKPKEERPDKSKDKLAIIDLFNCIKLSDSRGSN